MPTAYEPYRGTHCVNRVNVGPTMVPYGEGMVPLGCDDYECALGYDPNVCDCPPESFEPGDAPLARGERLRWDTMDDGDYAHDTWREDGRCYA